MPLLRSLFKILLLVFNVLVFYFLFAIIGLFWARNRGESVNMSGIPLMIHGNGFHTELYLPIEDSLIHYNWLHFLQDSLIIEKHATNKYISFGWAEEEWSIAGVQNNTGVLMAMESLLWPWNKSIMHVRLTDTFQVLNHPFTQKRFLDAAQYRRLISFIKKGFIFKNNRPVVKSYKGYDREDYFFSSNRNYNAFNTCNQWTADALNASGIRCPAYAPFAWSISYQVTK